VDPGFINSKDTSLRGTHNIYTFFIFISTECFISAGPSSDVQLVQNYKDEKPIVII
jgi:hypothetical protein